MSQSQASPAKLPEVIGTLRQLLDGKELKSEEGGRTHAYKYVAGNEFMLRSHHPSSGETLEVRDDFYQDGDYVVCKEFVCKAGEGARAEEGGKPSSTFYVSVPEPGHVRLVPTGEHEAAGGFLCKDIWSEGGVCVEEKKLESDRGEVTNRYRE